MRQQQYPYKTFHQILEDQAREFGSKVYIESVDQDRCISFLEMNNQCNRLANFLRAMGLNSRDVVTLIGGNSLETLIVFFGVLKYGAVINPINSEESPSNIRRLIKRVRPRLIIRDHQVPVDLDADSPASISFQDLNSPQAPGDSLFVRLRDMNTEFGGPEAAPADFAEILFTSGTTEFPKTVAISRSRLYLMADEVVDRIEVTPEDRILEYRSYSWASVQLLTIMSTMIAGATLVLAKKFSRSRFASWIKDHGVTKSAGVPTVFNVLVSKPVDLHQSEVPHIKFITSSSAPLSVQILERFQQLYGIAINQMAGMTEAGWMMGNPPYKRKPGSVGTPMKYKTVSIRRADGSACGEGEEGEIVINGESMGEGYLDEEGKIEKFPEQGFNTGDIGYMDADGYVFITGRKKDLIIRGGVNISPLEVSDILLKHPDVQEAATVGAPDTKYGEEVVSFVVPEPGRQIDEEEIISFCKESLPDFKVPKRIYSVESIPKKSRGKVSKQQLLKIIQSLEETVTCSGA